MRLLHGVFHIANRLFHMTIWRLMSENTEISEFFISGP